MGSPALWKVGPSRVSVRLPGPELNTVICLCLFGLHPTRWETQPVKNLFPFSTDPGVIHAFETVTSFCCLWDYPPPYLDSMLLYITPIKISPFTWYLDLLLLSISKFRFLFLTFPSLFFLSLVNLKNKRQLFLPAKQVYSGIAENCDLGQASCGESQARQESREGRAFTELRRRKTACVLPCAGGKQPYPVSLFLLVLQTGPESAPSDLTPGKMRLLIFTPPTHTCFGNLKYTCDWRGRPGVTSSVQAF